MLTFLALGPGVYQTGVALFQGASLGKWRLLAVPCVCELEGRLRLLIQGLEEFPDIRQVVCGKATASEHRQPAPELQALIRRLKRLASGGVYAHGHKFLWQVYRPSTVLASVRPWKTRRVPPKEVISRGVRMLYGDRVAGLGQNVLDAIAVGHCHLSEMREVVKR